MSLSFVPVPVLATTQTAASASAAPKGAPTKVIHVSPQGNDAHRGTKVKPVRTISRAVDLAPQGARVLVASGTYHESVVVQKQPNLTIAARKGAKVWLDGSRVVRGWQTSGNDWVSTGWTADFGSTPTLTGRPDTWGFINPAFPMAAHPDQVWVGGKRLRQVGSREAVAPGAFYVDDANDRLYIGTNPTMGQVRASDLSKAMSIRAAGTTVSGINARRYATAVPQVGTITVERPRVTIKNLTVRDNATSGLQVGAEYVTIDRVRLVRNGMIGLRANGADHLKVLRTLVRSNNVERFNFAPAAGGAKLGRLSDVTVRNSTFRDNQGTGLWFDESVYGMQIYGSRMLDNARHGMSLEISGQAMIANNLIARNADNGIKINNTDRVKVWNNTLTGNGRQINIVQDDRDLDNGRSYRDFSLPLTLRSENISVQNNVIVDTNTNGNCLLCVEDHSHRFSAKALNVRARSNVYHRRTLSQPQWLIVWSRGEGNPETFTSLSAFKRETGGNVGRSLRGKVPLSAKLLPTRRIRAMQKSVAVPLPRKLAKRIGRQPGTRRLGSWVQAP